MYLFLFTDCFIVSQYLSAALPYPIWSGHCRIFSTEHSAYQTLLPCLSSRELSIHLLANRFSSPLSPRVSPLPSHSQISLNVADRSALGKALMSQIAHFSISQGIINCLSCCFHYSDGLLFLFNILFDTMLKTVDFIIYCLYFTIYNKLFVLK